MKLALCDLILESATSPRHVADYLLFWLNKFAPVVKFVFQYTTFRSGNFSYLKAFDIEGSPIDDIEKFLIKICATKVLLKNFSNVL